MASRSASLPAGARPRPAPAHQPAAAPGAVRLSGMTRKGVERVAAGVAAAGAVAFLTLQPVLVLLLR